MLRPRLLTALGAAALAAGSVTTFVGATAAPTAPGLPTTGATPRLVPEVVRVSAFPVYDAHGRRVGRARWRMSTAGGNCCETYVTATPSGRLVESGGTYPWYTDDEGKHWYEVKFDVPDQNDNGKAVAGGEGATVVGPAGVVYGVTWDAYSGDHLQAYTYTPQTNAWKVSEVVVKTPVYDRPWVTLAQGHFTLDGQASKQLLDVDGGTLTKDVVTLSSDGLNYSHASYPTNDEKSYPTTPFRIKVVKNPAADWWQPYPWMSTLPLNQGSMLYFAKSTDSAGKACTVGRLDPATATWRCVALRGNLNGNAVIRQDSRGYLTELTSYGPGALQLATSRDGGLHWSHVILRAPKGTGTQLEMDNVAVNGRLGQAVVNARYDKPNGDGQDMVFRVSEKRPTPRLLRTYLVGKGDIVTASGVGNSVGYRFDYPSVAILPDGHIAVSFDDSTCLQPSLRDSTRRSPEVAILT
jgi:hypothetical protein